MPGHHQGVAPHAFASDDALDAAALARAPVRYPRPSRLDEPLVVKPARAAEAAEALGITAHRLKALGLVDKIVNEPVGGAHRDHRQMAAFLKRALNDAFRQVSDLKPKELLERRYERLQSYGRFNDTKADSVR